MINWKNKRDKYDDEYADDESEINSPRLTDTMDEPMFIRRDEFNSRTMRKLGVKQW